MSYNENLSNKIYQYFQSRLDLKASTNGYERGDCPYCGEGFTFGINFQSGKTRCFRCDEGNTNPIEVIKYRENLTTYSQVLQFLKLQDDYGFSFIPKKSKEQKEIKVMALPDEYRPITMGNTPKARLARSYMIGRGFSLEHLDDMGIGYGEGGPYDGYIIIPYYIMGKLVYFTARKYRGNGPKFNNPPEEDFGIGKTQLIYNQDALITYNHIFGVESATNSLTLGPKAAAFGGKDVSPYQLYLLHKSPFSSMTIILDPDAIDKAFKLAFTLVETKKVRVVVLPEGEDVNSLGKKKTMRYVAKTPWSSHKELRKQYNQYK